MRKVQIFLVWMGLSLGAAGCSSAYFAAGSSEFSDDLYGMHDRAEIYNRKQAEAEAARAAAEAERARWEAMLAQAQAKEAQSDYENYTYQNVLADTYQSAYYRRLKGFSSLSYNLPSSYYELRYSPAYQYVTAYDPMNYNIVVMGDEVWVEPKYISSMFGTWGAPSYTMRLYAGWGGWGGWGWGGWPYSYNYYSWWGYPHSSWWDWHYDWSWNFGWGWGWHHGPAWGGHHHSHSTPHYPNYRPWGGRPNYRGQAAGVNHSSPYTSPRGGNYRGSGSASNYRGQTTSPGRGGLNGGRSGSNYRGKGSSTISQPRRDNNDFRIDFRDQINNNSNHNSGTSNYRPSGGSNYRSSSSGSSFRGGSSGGSGGSGFSGGSGSSGHRGSGNYRR